MGAEPDVLKTKATKAPDRIRGNFFFGRCRLWLIRAGQAPHREFDRAAGQLAPAFDRGHVGGLRVAAEHLARLVAGGFARQRKGIAPVAVAATATAACAVLGKLGGDVARSTGNSASRVPRNRSQYNAGTGNRRAAAARRPRPGPSGRIHVPPQATANCCPDTILGLTMPATFAMVKNLLEISCNNNDLTAAGWLLPESDRLGIPAANWAFSRGLEASSLAGSALPPVRFADIQELPSGT